MDLMSCKNLSVWLSVVLLAVLVGETSQNGLDGNGANVCWRSVSFKRAYRQSYQGSYRQTYYTSCGLFGWWRCTRSRTRYTTNYRTIYVRAYKKQYFCCSGWSQVGSQCSKAICTQSCVRGTCTRPNYCSCYQGYNGQRCDKAVCTQSCVRGTCTRPNYCSCEQGYNGERCDKAICTQPCVNGTCTRPNYCSCDPGYDGERCDKAICVQPCVNGTCTRPNYCSCNTGIFGQRCDRDCPVDKWGSSCINDCLCQNNATCSPHTGNCKCTPGWEGQYCNKTCDHGYYGNRCQNNCTCLNGATCDPVNGNCTCVAGYRGERCESTCKEGTFGSQCKGICACQNDAMCSTINGSCNCTSGYTGEHCECIVKDGLIGCKLCNCSQWGTCDHFTGRCVCKPGYTGETCQPHCPNGWYVPGCSGNCECHQEATCYKSDGSCDCLPGWTGSRCKDPCPTGYYGKNCQSKCQVCKNGTLCDPVTGQCRCPRKGKVEVCLTVSNTSEILKERQTQTVPFVNYSLIIGLVSGFSLLFLISLVLGCFIYRKRKRQVVYRDENCSVTFSRQQQPDVGHGNAAGVTREPDYEQVRKKDEQGSSLGFANHAYEDPVPYAESSRAKNANNQPYVSMLSPYINCQNRPTVESNIYESVPEVLGKQSAGKPQPVTYDNAGIQEDEPQERDSQVNNFGSETAPPAERDLDNPKNTHGNVLHLSEISSGQSDKPGKKVKDDTEA